MCWPLSRVVISFVLRLSNLMLVALFRGIHAFKEAHLICLVDWCRQLSTSLLLLSCQDGPARLEWSVYSTPRSVCLMQSLKLFYLKIFWTHFYLHWWKHYKMLCSNFVNLLMVHCCLQKLSLSLLQSSLASVFTLHTSRLDYTSTTGMSLLQPLLRCPFLAALLRLN